LARATAGRVSAARSAENAGGTAGEAATGYALGFLLSLSIKTAEMNAFWNSSITAWLGAAGRRFDLRFKSLCAV
jgi:hypothetical protein